LDDGTIGIIVEEGKWDGNLPGEDGFNLGYYHFSLDWLMEGDKE
jgi:sialidase-1